MGRSDSLPRSAATRRAPAAVLAGLLMFLVAGRAGEARGMPAPAPAVVPEGVGSGLGVAMSVPARLSLPVPSWARPPDLLLNPSPTAIVRAVVPEPVRHARHLLVAIERDVPITARPGGGRVLGTMAASSRYYGTSMVAWVLRTTPDGRYGEVAVPYGRSRDTGWIPLRGLHRSYTDVRVRVDLSRHLLVVQRGGEVLGRFRTAIGSPSSPTPTGRYFVTDRVAFSPGHVYGGFAFGISGIQSRLPAGWEGGDQLAIHGTNDPSSIGRSVSAGCLRVSAGALARLKPLLRLGTPVVVVR